MHGGKYQFGGFGTPPTSYYDDASFSGHGGVEQERFDDDDEPLPNWAQRMAPNPNSSSNDVTILTVPSNSNPMDGMVYSASIEIRNEERTWEKFYAKLLSSDGGGGFTEVGFADAGLSVTPRSGSLAPRGGASNACDASQPYSDTAVLRVTQSPDAPNKTKNSSTNNDLWLVVGTEEEQWTYALDLLED